MKTEGCIAEIAPGVKCGRNLKGGARGLCLGHYRRDRRGKPVDGPLREKTGDKVVIPGTAVSSEVAIALETAAAVKNLSMYELQRQILTEWYERVILKKTG